MASPSEQGTSSNADVSRSHRQAGHGFRTIIRTKSSQSVYENRVALVEAEQDWLEARQQRVREAERCRTQHHVKKRSGGSIFGSSTGVTTTSSLEFEFTNACLTKPFPIYRTSAWKRVKKRNRVPQRTAHLLAHLDGKWRQVNRNTRRKVH